jgi:hypothetical protein
VQAWLVRPGCRIKLHFIPTYCPHLDPIERLWGLMPHQSPHFSIVGTGAESAGFVGVSAQSGLEHRGGQGG